MRATALLLGVLFLAGCGATPAVPTHHADERLAVLSVPSTPLEAHPETRNNSAKINVGPQENVAALQDLILSAQKTIYIGAFTFGNDAYGSRLAAMLSARAREGLKVVVLADFVGSGLLPDARDFAKGMKEAGVQFRYYRPRKIKRDGKVSINITHRKLYLADGNRGFVGGMNLRARFETEAQDVLVDFRGEVAQQLHQEFVRDWLRSGGAPLEVPPLEPAQYGDVAVRLTVTSPPDGRFESRDAFIQAIDGARREILIEHQYLTDERILDRLEAALDRKVAMRILVPGESSSVVFSRLHSIKLNALIAKGAKVRLYHGKTHEQHAHSKYMAVDGHWATIGSTNLDTRSLLDNQELNLVTSHPALVKGLQTRLFEPDWSKGLPVVRFPEHPWYERPINRLLDLVDYYL